MGNNIVFSIICPIYNSEKLLSSAYNSIKGQNYQNWELILVDDGSTDSTSGICDEFAKKDGRIKVIHKKNEGQSAARLEGVSIAKGDYLLFLDSDDEYELNALEIINDKLQGNDYEFIIYNAKKIVGDTSNPIYNFESQKNDSPIVECFCKRNVSYLWTICFKKELLLNIDNKTKDIFLKLRYSEDFYLIYNILKNVKKEKFAIIDQELYKYINNPSSITNNQNADKLMDRFYAFNYVYEDLFNSYEQCFTNVNKQEKDLAGWTALSAARRIAIEYDYDKYIGRVKEIRRSFIFNHLCHFKKDKYTFFAYILLRLKMYRVFKNYIIKHERKQK